MKKLLIVSLLTLLAVALFAPIAFGAEGTAALAS